MTSVIDGAKWAQYWDTSVSALKGVPSIADGNSLVPNDRLHSVLGTPNYRDVFLKVEKHLNIVKGQIFNFKYDSTTGLVRNAFNQPQSELLFNRYLNAAIKTGTDEYMIFTPIRRVSNPSKHGYEN